VHGSRSWVEIVENYNTTQGKWYLDKTVIRDDSTSKTLRKSTIHQPEIGTTLGVSSDGKLVATSTHIEAPTAFVDVQTYSLNKTQAVVDTYKIPLPWTTAVYEYTLPTSGDKVAWVLLNGVAYHICVSDLHGARWQDVYSISQNPVNSASSRNYIVWPNAVRWVPGGKALSFVYRGQLYLVKIPE
jgi:hypothetical protein